MTGVALSPAEFLGECPAGPLAPAAEEQARNLVQLLRAGRRWVDPVPRSEKAGARAWNVAAAEVLERRGEVKLAEEVRRCGAFALKVTLPDGRFALRRMYSRRPRLSMAAAWAEAATRVIRPSRLLKVRPELAAVAIAFEPQPEREAAEALLRGLVRARQKDRRVRDLVAGGEALLLQRPTGVELVVLLLAKNEDRVGDWLLAFGARRGVGLHRHALDRRGLLAFFARAVDALKELGPERAVEVALASRGLKDHRSWGSANGTAEGKRRRREEGPSVVALAGHPGEEGGHVGSIPPTEVAATYRSNVSPSRSTTSPRGGDRATTGSSTPTAASPLASRSAAQPPSTEKSRGADPTRVRVEVVAVQQDEDEDVGPPERWRADLRERRRHSQDRERLEVEAAAMVRDRDFAGATAGHLVAAHSLEHARVYGVADLALDDPATWSRAVEVAADRVRDLFGGDAELAGVAVAWCWWREDGRERWRRQNRQPGRRLSWWRVLTPDAATEFFLARARRNNPSGGAR